MNEQYQENWQTDWAEFIAVVNARLLLGESLEQVAASLQGAQVTWTGTLDRREIPSGMWDPFAFLRMPARNISYESKEYTLRHLQLNFDRSRDALVEWWSVPLGSIVKFTGILGPEYGRQCIDILSSRCRIWLGKNPRLVSNPKRASETYASQEVESALNRPLPITERIQPPTPQIGLYGQPNVEWSTHRNTEYATLMQGGDVFGALVEFWEKVLGAFPTDKKWTILQVWGSPAELTATILCWTAGLGEQYPRLFAFSFGGIEDANYGAPGTTKHDRKLAVKAIKSFWQLLHGSLCAARNLQPFREVHPEISILAQEAGESTYKELLLP